MWNFENKYIPELDAHYSRIIASWANAGGSFEPKLVKVGPNRYKMLPSPFELWLKDDLKLSEEDRKNIKEMLENGKLELEIRAEGFWSGVKAAREKKEKETTEE